MSEWNVDLSEYFQTEEQLYTSEAVEPGMYHMRVVGMEDKTDAEHPRATLFCEVLAGSVDGQLGKVVRSTVWQPTADTDPRFLKSRYRALAQVAFVLGFRKAGEVGRLNFNPEEAVDRHFFGVVYHKTFTDPAGSKRTFAEISWRDSLPVDNDKPLTFPRDVTALVQAGYPAQQQTDTEDPAVDAI